MYQLDTVLRSDRNSFAKDQTRQRIDLDAQE